MPHAETAASPGRLRRTKVLATLGPSSRESAIVEAMAREGADGFRINTAHIEPSDVGRLVEQVRGVEAAVARPLSVLCDLAGPKLRVARDQTRLELVAASKVTIGAVGSGAAVTLAGLDPARECPPGSLVLLHDGRVALRVQGVAGAVVGCVVERGGEVAAGMGVNLPEVETSLPSLTPHDLECLDAAVAAEADSFALSFVRRAADVEDLRTRLREAGSRAPIVAKLEKARAVTPDELRAILAVADAVIVARGDLGAETAPDRVPVLQKEILRAARAVGVPAVVATEMLESMVEETRPTRAEAADVANAVYDGADALLLTAETAIGHHPVLAVGTAGNLIATAEAHPEFRTAWFGGDGAFVPPDATADAVAKAAVTASEEVKAAVIVCFTTTGRTARLVARHRPDRPVLALTPDLSVARALTVVWGVCPRVSAEHPLDHEGVVLLAEREAIAGGFAGAGDAIIVTHGAPGGIGAPTNLLRVHRLAGG